MTTNGAGLDSDSKIPDSTTVELNMYGDQHFQRWLVERIFHRKEMRFERGTLPPVVGFLTGFDSTVYTVSTTDSWPVLSRVLPRHGVTEISETGRSLHELDERVGVLIRKYTARLHHICEVYLIPSKRMVSDRVRQESI